MLKHVNCLSRVDFLSIEFVALETVWPAIYNVAIGFLFNYSRISVARTLTARLPRLFRTRSWFSNKNPITADII